MLCLSHIYLSNLPMHQCASSRTLLPTLMPYLGSHSTLGVVVPVIDHHLQSPSHALQSHKRRQHATPMSCPALLPHQACTSMFVLTPSCCLNIIRSSPYAPDTLECCCSCLWHPWVNLCKALPHLTSPKSRPCHINGMPDPLVTH